MENANLTYQNGKETAMDPVRIKLIRNSRGFGLEISIGSNSPEEAFDAIKLVNIWREEEYSKTGSNNLGV